MPFHHNYMPFHHNYMPFHHNYMPLHHTVTVTPITNQLMPFHQLCRPPPQSYAPTPETRPSQRSGSWTGYHYRLKSFNPFPTPTAAGAPYCSCTNAHSKTKNAPRHAPITAATPAFLCMYACMHYMRTYARAPAPDPASAPAPAPAHAHIERERERVQINTEMIHT